MWKRLWREWTIDKPAAFGDWLHQMLVVELAALLDRLTLRQVIAFIPVVILVIAYAHSIPLPPELMLVGDLLAYLDIFSIILLLSVIGRVSAMLYVVRQMMDRALRLASLARTAIAPAGFTPAGPRRAQQKAVFRPTQRRGRRRSCVRPRLGLTTDFQTRKIERGFQHRVRDRLVGHELQGPK